MKFHRRILPTPPPIPRPQPVDPAALASLITALSPNQAQLLIGLYHASSPVLAIITDCMPEQTAALFEAHHAIDAARRLTNLGVAAARQLAYAAHQGPDPRLLEAADWAEWEFCQRRAAAR